MWAFCARSYQFSLVSMGLVIFCIFSFIFICRRIPINYSYSLFVYLFYLYVIFCDIKLMV